MVETIWTIRFPTTLRTQSSNVVVQTDGGRRDRDCAAAAWIIGLWGQRSNECIFEPVVVHGTFLSRDYTVLCTEAIALDEASREVDDLLTC